MTRCDCCAVTLSRPIEQFGPVGVTLCAECWLSFGEGQSRGLEIVEEEMEAQQWEPDGWVPTNWDSEGAY